MKPKSKHAQLKRKKEFRYKSVEIIDNKKKTKRIRHPAYVFLEKGNVLIYVNITHSNSVKNLLVIELSKNPNPEDNRKSFWVAEIRKDTKDKFGRREDGWTMDDEDDLEIRNFFEKTKK